MELNADKAARKDWQRRALAAWHRAGEVETPSGAYVVEHEGLYYVNVTGKGHDILATFRVKPKPKTGIVMLQRMRRPPRDVAPR